MPILLANHEESSDTWRLILSPPAPGDWNMAVDEALMESAVQNDLAPTLRLYSWEPPCLSLGYAQSVSDVNEVLLAEHGWTLVRRPTGGRAILHTDEITYSITGRLEDPIFSGSILESYHRLAAALLSAITFLDVTADLKEIKDPSTQNGGTDAVCFEVASNYEITYQGKKLIGSAQARRNQGFLQHGSLPLFGNLDRINEVIRYPSAEERNSAKDRLLKHATTLETVLGFRVSWQKAADAFIAGFQKALGIEFERSKLSVEETERVQQLKNEKYGNRDWNERR
jgi:lipoate-protein ligase A